jgi:hypothetical protein
VGALARPWLIRYIELLLNRINRAYMRFQVLMALYAAGLLRTRRGPHTGGLPHPENLLRGNPFPCRWLIANLGLDASLLADQLEELLATPEAAEVLYRVPAAVRALRPLRRLLGCGPYDRILNRPAPQHIRPDGSTRHRVGVVPRPWRPPTSPSAPPRSTAGPPTSRNARGSRRLSPGTRRSTRRRNEEAPERRDPNRANLVTK